MLDLAVTEPAAPTSRPGVVACALYRDGRRVQDVDVGEIGAFAGVEDGIVWLGLHEPDAALLNQLQAQLGLHELIIEDANQVHQRAKLDIYDNILFIALRTARLAANRDSIWRDASHRRQGFSSSPSATARQPPMPR